MKRETLGLILIQIFLVFILSCLFIRLSHAEGIVWSFDDTPTIEECVRDSQNTYDVCEILSKMAKDAIEKDTVFISTFKEVE